MGKKIATIIAILTIISVAAAVYFINPFEKKGHAGLQVITNEVDASLFLNEVHLDQSPYINRKIKPGRYTLTIVPDNSDLATAEFSIALTPNTLTAIFWKPATTLDESSGVIYELEQISSRNKAELQIITEPIEAIIHFGNRDQEISPHIYQEIEPGKYSIKISLPSYETQEQRFNLTEGYRLKIRSYLAKESGDLAQQEDEPETIDNESTQIESNEQELLSDHVLIKNTNFFRRDKEVLRVRDSSSAAGVLVGFVEVEKKYKILEEESDWLKIAFEDAISGEVKEGWVSGQYLEIIRVEAQTDQ